MIQQLNIQFSPSDLSQFLQSGQQVVLVRASNIPGPSVAWLTFSPFQQNTITWEENYEIYVSNTQLQPGAQITLNAAIPAQPNQRYVLQSMFLQDAGPQNPPGEPGSFQVVNQDFQMMAVGLAQSPQVNGAHAPASPINVVQVFPQQLTVIMPENRVWIFAAAFLQSGTVISQLPGNALPVDFQSGTTSVNVQYDASRGGFVLQQATALP